MRRIDADELNFQLSKRQFCAQMGGNDAEVSAIAELRKLVDSQPTLDTLSKSTRKSTDQSVIRNAIGPVQEYCPYCGARIVRDKSLIHFSLSYRISYFFRRLLGIHSPSTLFTDVVYEVEQREKKELKKAARRKAGG